MVAESVVTASADRRNNLTSIKVLGNFVFVVTENLWAFCVVNFRKTEVTDVNVCPATGRVEVLMNSKRRKTKVAR